MYLEDSHITAAKMFRISNNSPHLRHENLDLFSTPTEDLADGIEREAIQAQIHIQANKLSFFLESSILWPSTKWDGMYFVHDLLKACFSSRVLDDSIRDVESTSNLVASIVE
jgi:hypothetical protein